MKIPLWPVFLFLAGCAPPGYEYCTGCFVPHKIDTGNDLTVAQPVAPTAQQIQEQRAATLQIESDIQAEEANPPANVKEYEQDLDPDYRIMFVATRALQCGLRTNLWFSELNQGVNVDKTNEREKIPMSSIDMAVVHDHERFEMDPSHLQAVGCDEVASSDDLSAADDVEQKYAAYQQGLLQAEPLP